MKGIMMQRLDNEQFMDSLRMACKSADDILVN